MLSSNKIHILYTKSLSQKPMIDINISKYNRFELELKACGGLVLSHSINSHVEVYFLPVKCISKVSASA